jgi:hypothetical protein
MNNDKKEATEAIELRRRAEERLEEICDGHNWCSRSPILIRQRLMTNVHKAPLPANAISCVPPLIRSC